MARSLEDLTPAELLAAERCLRLFWMERSDANLLRVGELLNHAVIHSPQTTNELHGAIIACGKDAALHGLSIERLIEILTSLANLGWTGRNAGVLLREVLPMVCFSGLRADRANEISQELNKITAKINSAIS